MSRLRQVARWLIALLFVLAGVNHFRSPDFYDVMIPPPLPWPRFWTLLTGVLEVVGGVGLLLPRLRRVAAVGVITMLVVFLWVHVDMLREPPDWDGRPVPAWLLWLRLPLQFVLIACVWWVGVGRGRGLEGAEPAVARPQEVDR